MKQKKILLLSSLAIFALLAGCEPTLNHNGRQVKFSARSNGVSTKTAYDGEASGYVIIAWQEGDQIRIYSPKNADGIITGPSESTPAGSTFGYFFADYGLTGFTLSGHEHKAKLVLAESNPNGLTWVTDGGSATFYSIYPKDVAVNSSGNNLRAVVTIPNEQNGWVNKNPKDITAVAEYPLVATQTAENGDAVDLRFDPAFSAFEFHLKSADKDITLNSFELSTEGDTYLTGTCYYDIDSKEASFVPSNASTLEENCKKSVKFNFPENTVITSTDEVKFTIFALPAELSQMTIRVNFDGSKSRSLKLKQNDEWISFPACHKARINGLALDAGSTWQLDIYTDVNKWTVYEKETSFSTQIGCDQWKDPNDQNKSLMVQGMWETGNHYADITGTVNGTSGYSKYYQIRTLKDDYFIVKFRPYAPVGGYWRVTPWFQSGDTASPDKFEILVFEEGDKPGEGTYSTDLTGQIMGNWVELHIKPKNYDPQEDDGVYVMMLHCDFSTSKTFDEGTYYSVDSEFQDVHGDGRYSYWRFTLDKSYTGGN